VSDPSRRRGVLGKFERTTRNVKTHGNRKLINRINATNDAPRTATQQPTRYDAGSDAQTSGARSTTATKTTTRWCRKKPDPFAHAYGQRRVDGAPQDVERASTPRSAVDL
jgi:hypothetical protein